jgi:hypothetical protein
MTKSRSVAATANDNSIPGSRIEDNSIDPSKIIGGVGGGDATGVTYTANYTNAVQRTVQAKLDDFVSITDFGAIGDDNPDNANTNRIAIIRALATGKAVYVPTGRYWFNQSSASNGFGVGANRVIFGDGPNSVLIQSNTNAWIRVSGSNTQIRDLSIEANPSLSAPVGMFLNGTNQKNVLIENVRFFLGNQRVYLGNVSQVRVVNCTFEETGYGVIQQFGAVSNDVLVTGCNAINIKSDFVEANCVGMTFTYTAVGGEIEISQASPGTKTGSTLRYFPGIERVTLNGSTLIRGIDYTALNENSIVMLNPPSLSAGNVLQVRSARTRNWAITNNVMEKTSNYPLGGTEKRFVGITAVHGVVIDGNVATDVSGDSFVHLEDFGGECVVSNNFFMNLASGFGHVFLINSEQHVLITGNIFKQVDPNITNSLPCVYSSNDNTNDITFTNNRVIGAIGGPSFSGFGMSFQTGRKIVANNIFQNLTSVMSTSSVSNVMFSSNVIRNCQTGITGPNGSGSRFSIFNNTFEGTADTYDINVQSQSTAVRAPRNWIVQGNRFGKGARFAGNGLGGGNGEIRDIYVSNNVLESGATGIFIGGTRTRVRESGNTSETDGTTDFSFTTARFEPRATAPASPPAGQVYYDSPSNKLKVWNGSSWQDLN